MKTKTHSHIKEFIESSQDEREFFSIDKENLISLRNYILELKEKEEKFNKSINLLFESIKGKNDWVERIEPAFDSKFLIVAKAKNQPNIYVNQYGNGFAVSGYAQGLLVGKRFEERRKIIKRSREELDLIAEIIARSDFEQEERGFKSVSENFIIQPIDFDGINIYSHNKHFATLDTKKEKAETNEGKKPDYQVLVRKIYLQK